MTSSQRSMISVEAQNENVNEMLGIKIAKKKYIIEEGREFMKEFPIKWSNSTPIANSINWSEMKEVHGWGYLDGSIMHSMINWIYIRPDVADCLDSDKVGGPKGLICKAIPNTHYFLVKEKAIAYFKKMSVTIEKPRLNQYYYDESDDDQDTPPKPSNKRVKSLFDEEAIETSSKK